MHIPVPSRWPDGWLQVSRFDHGLQPSHRITRSYRSGLEISRFMLTEPRKMYHIAAITPLTLNAHVGHSSGKRGLAASFWGVSRGRCCSAPTPSFRPVKATKAPKALLSVHFFRLTF